MSKQTGPTSAEKINVLLASKSSASVEIERLMMETETAIDFAQRKLEQENALALDPSLNAEEALHTIKLCELEVARLRNSLHLLQQEYGKVLLKEEKERFHRGQHEARIVRDAASEQFRRIEALQQEMVDIYNEALRADALVAEANSNAPAGENSRLLKTEEHARRLEDGFTRARPSLLKETVLIGFDGQQLWPPRSSVGAAYAAMMTHADHRQYPGDASSEWWRRGERVEAARAQKEQEQLAQRDDFYNGRTR
jgi:hypothetical protein